MGFFSDLLDPLDFSGRSAGKAATRQAALQAKATEQAIEEERRQFDLTTERLTPFFDEGLGLLPQFSESATLQGFGSNIDDIFSSGALDPLVSERLRTVRNENSRNGLRRSTAGLENIADVPTELAFVLEDLLNKRQGQLVGSSQNAAARLGAFGANSASNVGGLLQDQSNAIAQGIERSQQAKAQGAQNAAGLGLGLLAAFSDPVLKTNVVQIGRHAGLNVYTWDWIDEAPDFVKTQPSVGFMADEVLELYPESVGQFAGLLTLNYAELMEAA